MNTIAQVKYLKNTIRSTNYKNLYSFCL